MDKNKILQYAYEQVSQDNKLIRLATITTFIHSLIFVFYIIYQWYSFITKIEWKDIDMSAFTQYLQYILTDLKTYLVPLIVIWIILAIWYMFLPPVADGTLIFYINDPEKKWKTAIMKWFFRFFPMFENHGLFSFFNFFVFIVVCMRIYVLGFGTSSDYWVMNIFVVFIMIIRFLVILWVTIFLPYTKFFIILQNKWVRDAIKDSISLAVENIWITFKFVLIGYILYLRFFVNIILILWLPSLLMFLAVQFNYDQSDIIKNSIYVIFAVMIVFSAYINWIIEAFFMTYWYKVFEILTWMESIEVEKKIQPNEEVSTTVEASNLNEIDEYEIKKNIDEIDLSEYDAKS